MKKKIRVMVVDDCSLDCGGLVPILDRCDGVEIVAVAVDSVNAIEYALKTQPDIAVIDVSMRHLDSLEALHGIRAVLPRCRLLTVTARHDDESIVPIVKAGASGYLLKEKAATELDDAIKALSSGQVYFGQRATRILAEQLVRE